MDSTIHSYNKYKAPRKGWTKTKPKSLEKENTKETASKTK